MAIYYDQQQNTYYVDIRFRDSDGNIRSKKKRGFKTEQAAKRWENKNRIVDNLTTQTTRSLHDIAFEYIDTKRTDIKPENLATLKWKVEHFFPDVKISYMNRKRLLDWRNDLNDLKKANGTLYSTSYKNALVFLMKAVFKYAIIQEYINKNPAEGLKRYAKQYEDTKMYSIVDPETFFEAYSKLKEKTWNDIWFKMFVLLSYTTGARRAELKALQFKDYVDGKIHIYKSIPGKDPGDRNKVEKTKTKSSIRWVTLDNFSVNELNRYVDLCKQQMVYDPDFYMFGHESPLPNNTIQTRFNKLELGCRLHDLRHSHATLLIQNNVPINVVSKRLGHQNVEMTLAIYTHMFKNDDNLGVEVMNRITDCIPMVSPSDN